MLPGGQWARIRPGTTFSCSPILNSSSTSLTPGENNISAVITWRTQSPEESNNHRRRSYIFHNRQQEAPLSVYTAWPIGATVVLHGKQLHCSAAEQTAPDIVCSLAPDTTKQARSKTWTDGSGFYSHRFFTSQICKQIFTVYFDSNSKQSVAVHEGKMRCEHQLFVTEKKGISKAKVKSFLV